MWIILDLVGLLVAARAVSGGRTELLNGLGSLPRLSSIWLVPAVAAECCTFIALALAQRRILRAGGVNVGTSPLARLAVTSQAVGACCRPATCSPVSWFCPGGPADRICGRAARSPACPADSA